MKKISLIVFLIAATLGLQGCNTGVAFSLLGDLVELRIERAESGEGHIEDVFVDEDKTEQK